MRFLFVVASVSGLVILLDGCGCPPVACPNPITVNLIDESGAPTAPASGTVQVGGEALDFLCQDGGVRLDGGSTFGQVRCGPTSLTVLEFGAFDLTVRDTQGRRFSGMVTPMIAPSPPPSPFVCSCGGAPGTATVTVRAP
jgi:hypothetical protein